MAHPLDSLLTQASLAHHEGSNQAAKRLLERAMASIDPAAEPALMARVLRGLGECERRLGNVTDAVARYQQALPLFRDQATPLELAHFLRHIGDIHVDLRQFDRARPHYDEALELYREHGDPESLDTANALSSVAIFLGETGDRLGSLRLWREAWRIYDNHGIEAGVAEANARLADLEGA